MSATIRKKPKPDRTSKNESILTSSKKSANKSKLKSEIEISQDVYQTIFMSCLDGVLLTAPDGRIFAANPAACQMLGRTEQEICEVGLRGIVDRDDPGLITLLDEISRLGEAKGELAFIRKNGSRFQVNISSAIFDTSNGLRISMIVRDITERQQAEKALLESEAWFSSIFQTSPLGIAITRVEDDKIVDVNQAWQKIIGLNREEVIGRTPLELHTWVDPEARKRFVNKLHKQGAVHDFEFQVRQKSGAVLDLSMSAALIEVAGKPGILSMVNDITEHKRAEEMLKKTEQDYRMLAENSPDLIARFDTRLRHLYVNPAAARSGKLSASEYIGLTMAESGVSEPVATRWEQRIRQVLRTGKMVDVEDTFPTPEGIRYFHTRFVPELTPDGSVNSVLSVAHDITERKRAEQALQESEARLQAVFENLPFEFWVCDSDGRCVMQNPIAIRHWGDYIDLRPEDMGIPEDIRAVWQENNRRALSGQEVTSETEFIYHGEQHCQVNILTPIRVDDQIRGFLGANIDITERKRTEEALRYERDFAEGMIETAQAIVLVLDTHGCIVRFNPYMEEISGYALSEVQGKDWFTTFLPERDRKRIRILFQKAIGDIQTRGKVNPIVTKDGRECEIEWSDKTLRDTQGKVIGLLSIGNDITERKQVEQELRESEAKLKVVFDMLPVGVSILDSERNISYINPAMERILDISRERLFKGDYKSRLYLRPDGTPMPAEEFASIRVLELQRAVHNVDTGIVKEDGNLIWVNVSAVPVAFPDWKVVIVTSDITERKQAEEALRESEEKYRNVVERANDGILIIQDGAVKFLNPRLAEMWGGTVAEVMGTPFTNYVHPDELAHVTDRYRRRITGEAVSPTYETILRRKDGSKAYAELNAGIVPFENKPADLVIVRDITARKKAEESLRSSQQELAHAHHLLLALSQAAHAVQRTLITEEVYRAIQNQVTQLGYYVTGFELEEDGQSLHIAYLNYRSELVRKGEKMAGLSVYDFRFRPRDNSVYHKVITQGVTVFLKNSATVVADTLPKKLRSLAQPMTDLFKLDQSILAPMKVGDEAIGVLCITGPDLTEADKPAVMGFAHQAAIAIQNAQIYERVQQEITVRRQAEEELRESEAWFSTIFQVNPLGIAITRLGDNKIVDVNQAWQKITGFTREEAIGRTPLDLNSWVNPGERKRYLNKLRNQAAVHDFEFQIRQKSGAIIDLSLSAAQIDVTGEPGILSMVFDITDRKRAEGERGAMLERIQVAHGELSGLTARLQSALEDERTWIARELHDEFGQRLTAMKMDLTWLSAQIKPADSQVHEKIAEMTGMLQETIQYLRQVASRLRPGMLDDLGLNAAIEWYSNDWSARHGIEIFIRLPEPELPLDRELCTVLYRIFQEIMTNIARHSEATRVDVRLKLSDDHVILKVGDNGRGIKQQEIHSSSALGILGMRERAHQFGGELEISGKPGKGTTVQVRLPLEQR